MTGKTTMPDDEAVRMHAALADYHETLARQAALDVIHEHHADLAERLRHEVTRIPQRAEAARRVAERFRE